MDMTRTAFQEVLDKRKDVEDNISISLSIFRANPLEPSDYGDGLC